MAGQHIVVTGVSRGLGRALVDGLIAAGHRVSGCARSADAMAALARQYGSPHHFQAVDLTDEAAVQRWSTALMAANGVPDMLINNAGLINTPAPLWEVPLVESRAVVEVNLLGTMATIRYLGAAMVERGEGLIINLSSGWGRSTSPQVAPYCATKWAVEGLTQALAQELPPALGAIALNPGIIQTEMLGICFGKAAQQYPDPAEWSQRAVPYILSLRPHHNGQALTVPGG